MLSTSAPVTPMGRAREVQLQHASFTSGARPSRKLLQQHFSPSSSVSTPLSILDSVKSFSPPSKATTPASDRLEQIVFKNSLADIAENWRHNSKRTGIVMDQTCNSEWHSQFRWPSVSTATPSSACVQERGFMPGESLNGYPFDSMQHRDQELPSCSPSLWRQTVQSENGSAACPEHTLQKDYNTAFEKPSAHRDLVGLPCSSCACLKSGLVMLHPCRHQICASCLTGSINIVCEEDFSCGVCRTPVASFNFNSVWPSSAPFFNEVPESLQCRPATFSSSVGNDRAIIRIDNVPWDVTPPDIVHWLNDCDAQAYLLLDTRGKTESYAFAELPVFRAHLALQLSRSKILGEGKRARVVTVTLSSSDELLHSMFPSLKLQDITRRNHQPTLNIYHLEATMSLKERDALFGLLRNPDSHYIKNPTLPMWKLAGILQRFPSSVAKHPLFRETLLKEALYAMTKYALESVRAFSHRGTQDLWKCLLSTLSLSPVFDQGERSELLNILEENIGISRLWLESSPTHTKDGNEKRSIKPPVVLAPSVTANAIIINPCQRLNPLLESIRNVTKEFGDIVPDFQVGKTTGVLFLSLKYHRLHPEYIYQRIERMANMYTLRVLLLMCDVSEHQQPIREITKTCLVNNMTVMVAWTLEEAGFYLSTFKAYEYRPPDLIKERVERDFNSMYKASLTSIAKVNKTDVETLRSNIGSLADIAASSTEYMQLLPGLGRVKVRRIRDAFEKPFQYSSNTSSQTTLSTQVPITITDERSDPETDKRMSAKDANSLNNRRRSPSPVWDIELDLNESDYEDKSN